jgi:hypothetical protein
MAVLHPTVEVRSLFPPGVPALVLSRRFFSPQSYKWDGG